MKNQRITPRHNRLLAATLAVGVSALAACGDDGSNAIKDGVLTVEMSDFAYDGIPKEIPTGTKIEVTNSSESELHEFVTFRLPNDDDRPLDDIMADPGAILGGGPPVAVLLAPPGSSDMIPAVGDGVLSEPGRYVILCAIPTGANPDEYLAAAASSDGPPQVDGGQPHFMAGMFAEVTVTG